MQEEEKSREQLIKELKEVRRCFDELAASEARLKKAEEETQLLKRIIVSINESEDLNAAFFAVLEKICRTTDWAYGEVWVPSRNGRLLERSPVWYSRSDGLAEFVELSEGFKFPVGKGLPGRVWSLKQPVWIKDVTLDDNFLRAHIAMEAGLKAGVAIPILARGEVIAVMAFYMFEAREKDGRFVEIVSAVAAQLGLIIRRKRAEEEVRRSEEHFRTLIENSTDLISILNRDGTIQYASPSHERILGYKPEELLGRSAFDLVHPDDFSRVKEAFKHAVETPFAIQSAEFRFRHKDGSWRFLESAGKSLLKDHSIAGVIINSRDTTERKKMEEALARSEEYYRSIFESSQDCICHISLYGKYLDINPSGLAMHEFDSIKDAIGKSSTGSITENRKVAEDANRRAALGETVSLKYKSRGKKGREIWWDSIVTPIRGADGSVRSILRISRDISERKIAELPG